jgi:hypothetical protein
MYAYQGGIKADFPWLPFSSLSLRYTKVEPYCYTHEYTETPWNRVFTDTSYRNNGESLGYYLPPNSDEILFRFEAMPGPAILAHLQYQLIRHGVEYGSGRVDGSSLGDKIIKDNNTTKYFLRDGVYRWDNVIKAGGSYSFRGFKIPVSLYGEAGVVISRFSRNDAAPGVEAPYHFLPAPDPEYPSGTGFIFSLGFRVFP